MASVSLTAVRQLRSFGLLFRGLLATARREIVALPSTCDYKRRRNNAGSSVNEGLILVDSEHG